VIRDAAFGMAHIYADNRDDLFFATGYATAEERLFLMDAIRRTAKGTLAGLTGPSAARGGPRQLTDQDFSDAELTAQFEALDERFGVKGARAQRDVLAYIDGINERIDEVNADPSKLPAEYPALGARPERWTVSDTAAMAVLLVTQFTVSNGGEERNAEMQHAFRKRFGRGWRKPYNDLRTAQDPEAVTVARAPHVYASDRPGKAQRGRNLMPDPGSVKPRNPLVQGPGAGEEQAVPAWVRSVNSLGPALPRHASNGVTVSARLSKSGRPLFAAGPQVDYWSPQIFVEYELHGGGIDVQGVSFPGASPWPLIGHGIDFAWSGTSANGDNQDTFVETLCEDESQYMYKGRCTPFVTREQRVTTPVSPIDPQPPQEIVHRTMRSVHGPVFAFATVGGKKVALTKAKGVNFRELDAVLSFMTLAENGVSDAKSFSQVMGTFPGTENWFYVDDTSAGFMQSGRYPAHAPGTDVDRPLNGDGSGDWQDFDPATYTYREISPSRRPRAFDPRDGYVISWNNKESPGWRKGPTEWSDGSVHHALNLERRLRTELREGGGKTDLVGLTSAVNLAAVTDVRGQENWPWIERVIGRRGTAADRKLLDLIDSWNLSGSKRLDEDGDNVYEHSPAIALMDAWWPKLIRAQFEPGLGKELFDKVEDEMLSLGGFGWDWASHNQKDLRAVLGRRVRGRYSRLWCGRRATCARRMLVALREAADEVRGRLGSVVDAWKVPATCAIEDPPICDQNVPTTAGAVSTPPFPWQNRGTYHQVAELVNGGR